MTESLELLTQEAFGSEHKEAYLRLKNNNMYLIDLRAMVNARNQPEYYLDVTIFFCFLENTVNLSYFKECISFLETLKHDHYKLACQEGFSIFAEKMIKKDKCNYELTQLQESLTKIKGIDTNSEVNC